MKTLRVSDQAEEDLISIWLYVSEHNESAAYRLISEINAKYSLLSEYPEIGRIREDLGDKSYRSFAVGSYIIFYRLTDEVIEISRVLHGSRDIGHALEEGP